MQEIHQTGTMKILPLWQLQVRSKASFGNFGVNKNCQKMAMFVWTRLGHFTTKLGNVVQSDFYLYA